MKTKKILTLALLPMIGMLTACSNDDAQMADRVPISLSATTLTLSETRTSASTDLNTDYMESGQVVKVRVRNTGSNGEWTDYAYTTETGGTLTPPTLPPYYPLDNTNVDIVAFSPYDAGNAFVVQEDQTNNDNYMASDLLFASKSNQEKTTTAVPLQFEHKMAKIVINVTASSVSGVSQIQSVTLQSVKRQVTFNEVNGTVSNAVTNGSTAVRLVKEGTTNTATGAAVIPAQTISGTLVTVVTNIGTATYSVESKAFNAGKVYVLNIYVGRTAIGATTQITGWTDTQSATVSSQDDSFRTFVIHDTTGPYSFTMVKVKGGTFNTFGGQTVSGQVSDFYIGQTEVTGGLWYLLMGGSGCWPTLMKQRLAAYPVVGMTYDEITNNTNGFLKRLNNQLASQTDGMTFKLPTDIQWEYAARGGINKNSYIYSGSNSVGDVATYNTDEQPDSKLAGASACCNHYANSLGIYDMSGNAWEWCSDYEWTVSANMVISKDYSGPASGTKRIVRGGGYNSYGTSDYLKVSYRLPWSPSTAHEALGFRLVLQ
jgi:formylglycine-generating enzyme required for sulfatase activity